MINDLQVYNSRMEKGMEDKLFFLSYLENYKDKEFVFVDYGCANGALILEILKRFPKVICFGIDKNKDMLAKAKANTNLYPHQAYFGNHDDATQFLKMHSHLPKVLNLCSVMHELHHYGTKEEMIRFYEEFINQEFTYIFLRDMYNDDFSDNYVPLPDYFKVILNRDILKQVKDFELSWGSTLIERNFIHFLLKYKYIENWERELKENYFPDIRFNAFKKNYQCLVQEMYLLPYLHDLWKKDFDIDVKTNTHICCVFQNKTKNGA